MATMDRRRILLVDDESSLTGVFRLLLEGTGRFLVEEENFGTRALDAARSFQPDLILLDVHLPDGNGIEIAAELRMDVALRVVPIIFLTGALTHQEAMEYGLEGRWRALAKPFTFPELRAIVDEVLTSVPALIA